MFCKLVSLDAETWKDKIKTLVTVPGAEWEDILLGDQELDKALGDKIENLILTNGYAKLPFSDYFRQILSKIELLRRLDYLLDSINTDSENDIEFGKWLIKKNTEIFENLTSCDIPDTLVNFWQSSLEEMTKWTNYFLNSWSPEVMLKGYYASTAVRLFLLNCPVTRNNTVLLEQYENELLSAASSSQHEMIRWAATLCLGQILGITEDKADIVAMLSLLCQDASPLVKQTAIQVYRSIGAKDNSIFPS